MPHKTGIILALLLVALGGSVMAALSGFFFLPNLSPADLHARFPLESPFEVMISCEAHRLSGSVLYGDDAPTGALSTGCKPQGNFYIVGPQSTPEEVCKSKIEPEVGFKLTSSGEVINIALTRSSGSPTVDRKVLQMVREGHYPPTNCGACKVSARVPVNLKRDDAQKQ